MSASVVRKIEAKAKCLVNLMERMKCEHNDPTRFVKDQIDNIFVCLRHDIRQPWNDWTIHVTDSTIPHAGRGLYLDGHAPAGRLLCLYSGELWTPEDIEDALSQLGAGNMNMEYDVDQLLVGAYTYARDNGSLIDGTPCEKIHDVLRNNPLCLGYCINHPPKGQIPNLLPLDVPYLFEKNTIKYKPTWHRKQGAIDDSITVFLAMDDIKNGDELFFDYDLEGFNDEQNNDKLPEWYHSIAPEVYETNL
eukprot:584896_1